MTEQMTPGEVLAVLDHAICSGNGARTTMHLTRAVQLRESFAALIARVEELQVTDSMVERACEGYLQEAKRQNFNPSEEWARSKQARDWMRAALIAALSENSHG